MSKQYDTNFNIIPGYGLTAAVGLLGVNVGGNPNTIANNGSLGCMAIVTHVGHAGSALDELREQANLCGELSGQEEINLSMKNILDEILSIKPRRDFEVTGAAFAVPRHDKVQYRLAGAVAISWHDNGKVLHQLSPGVSWNHELRRTSGVFDLIRDSGPTNVSLTSWDARPSELFGDPKIPGVHATF